MAACTCTSAASVTKPFPPLPFALSAVLTALALAPFARAVTSSTYFRCTSGPLVHRPTYFPCTRRLLVHAQFPAGCTSANYRSLSALPLSQGPAPALCFNYHKDTPTTEVALSAAELHRNSPEGAPEPARLRTRTTARHRHVTKTETTLVVPASGAATACAQPLSCAILWVVFPL